MTEKTWDARIPLWQIKSRIAREHVSATDADINALIAGAAAGRAEWTPELIAEAQAYARECHAKNVDLFYRVARGDLRPNSHKRRVRARVRGKYEQQGYDDGREGSPDESGPIMADHGPRAAKAYARGFEEGCQSIGRTCLPDTQVEADHGTSR